MHVYFSGIGGVGIGPLALLALEAGYTVSGSDNQVSEMTELISSKGVAIQIGQDGSQLAKTHQAKPVDWFVYSSALPIDHPELQFASMHGIKNSKRADFLNHLLEVKKLKLIAVAGTHGKTTTTAMLVWLFKQLNVPISYSIGTHISFGAPAQFEPASAYFVYECDEFDKNFLAFRPQLSLIPSLDYDHPDTYPTSSDYDQAFKTFVSQSDSTILWKQTATKLSLGNSQVITILNEAEPLIANIRLPGLHMRQNAWLVAQAAHQIMPDHSVASLANLLSDFPGSSRRFEKLANNLYSDYAHHPVEIAATIAMAKEINKKVVVVYQPHQNVRQHEIIREDAYRHCFDGVTKLYWLPTYLSREQPNLPVLSPTELMVAVNPDVRAEYSEMNDSLWQKLNFHAQHGDLVVGMSAGDLDGWLRKNAAR